MSSGAAQLVHSQEINHFRDNFRKVFLALTKSSEDNKQLIRKCRMLGRRLAETGTKLHQVLEIKLKDDGLIQDLRYKLKDAWMTAETYRSREHAANRLVKQMKSELDKLKGEVNRLHLDNKELKGQLQQQASASLFSSKSKSPATGRLDGVLAPGSPSRRRPATSDEPSREAARGRRRPSNNQALNFTTTGTLKHEGSHGRTLLAQSGGRSPKTQRLTPLGAATMSARKLAAAGPNTTPARGW